jgi:hypothetical protein
MKNGLIHYRIHDQQQGLEAGHSRTYRVWLYRIQQNVLTHALCPLTEADKRSALKKISMLQARRVIFHFLKSFRIAESYKMITESRLGWKGFFKGIVSFR